jgi:hypothetical protein
MRRSAIPSRRARGLADLRLARQRRRASSHDRIPPRKGRDYPDCVRLHESGSPRSLLVLRKCAWAVEPRFSSPQRVTIIAFGDPRRGGDCCCFAVTCGNGFARFAIRKCEQAVEQVLIPSESVTIAFGNPRRGGDSNPRYLAVYTLSRRAQSTTLPPLLVFAEAEYSTLDAAWLLQKLATPRPARRLRARDSRLRRFSTRR